MTRQPLRRVFAVVNGGTPTSEPEHWDGDVSWATPVDLGRFNGARIGETQRTLTTEGLRTGSSLVPAGSLIVSTRAPIGYIVETTMPTAFNQGCRGLVPRTGVDVRFFRYQLLAAAEHLEARGQGSTFVELSSEGLSSFPLFVPPVEQQRVTADYLDTETARIDRLVEARRRQLGLLDEREAEAVLSLLHAECDTPLMKLSRVADLLAGYSYRSGEFVEQDGAVVRLLRGINVDVGAIRWDETVWVRPEIAAATARFGLELGDIVVGMDRPIISTGVRVARLAGGDLPAMLVQRVARLRVRPGLLQDYLWCTLRSPRLGDYFAPMFTGVSVPHLSPAQIMSFEIPVPPVASQAAIAEAVRQIEESGRRLRAAIASQVDLLLERRHALITAAVTGELEIPGVAA